MARSNVKTRASVERTHEGAIARKQTPEQELTRTVMSCMLWEDGAYENGESIANRIESLVAKLPSETVSNVALAARTDMHLRHVPLYLLALLAKRRVLQAPILSAVIQRADEITEFLAIYAKINGRDGKTIGKVSNAVKRGIATAFGKFNEYQLAKYNREGDITLRDAMFLCHPTPSDPTQADLFARVANKTLATPDTWEVELSKSTDKRESWVRLLTERKLGGLALLRNLRNMDQAGVEDNLIINALMTTKFDRVLPFRFIAAARYAPKYVHAIEYAMYGSIDGSKKLPGRTVILVDNSGSMYNAKVSAKSDMDRSDAACALAVLVRELSDASLVISFSTQPVVVGISRGFDLMTAIKGAMLHGGTNIGAAVHEANRLGYDRVIVITDEQSSTQVPKPLPGTSAYFLNVATNQNGVDYGAEWLRINGWSESVVNFISEYERSNGK